MSAMRGKPPHGRLDKLVVDQRLVVTTGGGGRGRRRSQETREPCRGAIRAGRVGHAPAVMPTTASAGGATGATSTSMASGMLARALEFLSAALVRRRLSLAAARSRRRKKDECTITSSTIGRVAASCAACAPAPSPSVAPQEAAKSSAVIPFNGRGQDAADGRSARRPGRSLRAAASIHGGRRRAAVLIRSGPSACRHGPGRPRRARWRRRRRRWWRIGTPAAAWQRAGVAASTGSASCRAAAGGAAHGRAAGRRLYE